MVFVVLLGRSSERIFLLIEANLIEAKQLDPQSSFNLSCDRSGVARSPLQQAIPE
ncbi:MAG: hypothetical protein MUF49_02420 [Oculatellaceae cyanobacterium Prado106]|nr:hypothetical protein [Oculatellaceae cyanobacterium Prado106]